MHTFKTLIMIAALFLGGNFSQAQTMIGKNDIRLSSDRMTPEALWAMGRIVGAQSSPDGKRIVYQVAYYSVKANKSHHMLFVMNADGSNKRCLTTSASNETDAEWIENGTKIAYLFKGQVWKMNADGSEKQQLSFGKEPLSGFRFSPDGKQVILLCDLPYHGTIQKNPDDLPLTTGLVINDLNYRHWDHYVTSISHPFLAAVVDGKIQEGYDMLHGEPYECPMAPFGGIEQLAWSPDSRFIAYTCRKREGRAYAISTDSDIYLYDVATRSTRNLCKPEGYQEPAINPTKSMASQAVNNQSADCNVGYDQNPCFSPDGKYVAWQSMARNGYESDRNRLLVYNLATGEKRYVTESLDTNVDAFCWGKDSRTLHFLACWHACVHVYQTDLQGRVKQLTDGCYDYGSIQPLGSTDQLLVTRHSMSHPDDLYRITLQKKPQVVQLTDENCHIFNQLTLGKVTQRWVKTTDGKQMLVWVILPPHFDETKQYPTLLFCEGGPQSPVSQFWSYRWNFQIMAAHGYIIVAPNRRGLPGFGSAWNEQISGDWTGQCMNDYLSAIDDAASLPYVDRNRMGAVGASFGGFSVYYLAGHHNGRFKCFIAHDGAFNLESMYTDTEEAWFSNWEYEDAYWNADRSANARRTYDASPHKFVDKWETPILCIHGEKDYRINANQGFGAFNAARLKGIPAQLLLFPDENHWVLKPQNGILWQRTFFDWLQRWLQPKEN